MAPLRGHSTRFARFMPQTQANRHRVTASLTVGLLGIAVVTACDSGPTGLDRDLAAAIQTDSLAYTLHHSVFVDRGTVVDWYETSIGVEVSNPTN